MEYKELLEYRKKLLSDLNNNPDDHESRIELVCADCMICQEHVKDFGPAWKNTPYLEEIATHCRSILMSVDNADVLYNVCSEADDCCYNHPRIKLKLMKLQLELLPMLHNADFDTEDETRHLAARIATYEHNILAADENRLNDIISDDTSAYPQKSDPIEWTLRYEQCIDEAEQTVDELLKDCRRGMGFCHLYWHTLTSVLRKDFGINWRDPSVMNPGTLYD